MKMSNDQSHELVLELAKDNFTIFCEYVLKQKVGQFHNEIITELIDTNKNVVVMAARGHFKSTIFSTCFPLWQFWRTDDKKIEISVQSHNMSQARKIMGWVTDKIENIPILKSKLFPDDIFRAKWSGNHIVTKNGHEMYCRAFGHRGDHVDFSIVDDPLQDEEARSSMTMQSIKDTFWAAVFPITQSRRGKHIIVGTPMSYDDLYSDFSDKPNFVTMRYPAVLTDEEGNWLEPLFPEHFTLVQLKNIKDNMPSWAWQQEYMLDPVGSGNSLFPKDLIDKCVNLEYIEPEESVKKYTQYFMGCDIALSDSDRADNACFIVIEKTPGFPLKVIDDIFLRKGIHSEQQIEIIKQKNSFYNFSKIVIEKTGLAQIMAKKAVQELPSIVEEFDTTHSKKEQILGNLELLMRNNMLKLPDNKKLISELSKFGIKLKQGKQTFEALSGHDDQVMALAFACYAAGGWAKEFKPPVTLTVI
jgi:hypothetical protein